MEDQNLQALVTMLENMNAKSSIDEIVSAVEQIIIFVQAIKDSNDVDRQEIQDEANLAMDKALSNLKDLNNEEWVRIKAKVDNLRSGIDGIDGRDGLDGQNGRDGKDGKNGKDGRDGIDGSPDTPEQVVDKVNLSSKLIKKEKVEGLLDIERMASANGSAFRDGVSKTTYEQGIKYKVNSFTTSNITVSDTAPTNPQLYDLWVDIS